MIWHIFRKDLKLLWPLIVLVAATQFLGAWLAFQYEWTVLQTGRYGIPDYVFHGSTLLALGSMALLITLAVQQDALANPRLEWQTRPIQPVQLLVAKLLFATLSVHPSLLAADLVTTLAAGFPAGESLTLATIRNLQILVCFTLPVVALAALTRNVAQWLIATLILVVVGAGWVFITQTQLQFTREGLAVDWLQTEFTMLLVLAGVATVLLTQYLWRKPRWAFALILAMVFLVPLAQLPARAAFTIQGWMSPAPEAGDTVSMTFVPEEKRLVRIVDARTGTPPLEYLEVPLRIGGVPAGAALAADAVSIRLVDHAGHTVHQGSIASRRMLDTGPDTYYESFFLPRELYSRIREMPLRLELEYALILFTHGEQQTLKTTGQVEFVPGIGKCRQTIGDQPGLVYRNCLSLTSSRGSCDEEYVSLPGDPPRERGVPEHCARSADLRQWPHLSTSLFATGQSGSGRRGTDASGATTIFNSYRASAYFTHQTTIPRLRLADLEATQTVRMEDNPAPDPRRNRRGPPQSFDPQLTSITLSAGLSPPRLFPPRGSAGGGYSLVLGQSHTWPGYTGDFNDFR